MDQQARRVTSLAEVTEFEHEEKVWLYTMGIWRDMFGAQMTHLGICWYSMSNFDSKWTSVASPAQEEHGNQGLRPPGMRAWVIPPGKPQGPDVLAKARGTLEWIAEEGEDELAVAPQPTTATEALSVVLIFFF